MSAGGVGLRSLAVNFPREVRTNDHWREHHPAMVAGQTDRFVASALAHRVARNELEGGDVVPVGNLTPRRDFTDVRDVVRAYRLLVVHGHPGEVYNVCSGHDVAVAELAEQLVQLAERPMRLEADPALQRPVDIPVLRGDNTRLRTATGWTPEIPLHQTLADLLDHWRTVVAPAPAPSA